MKADVYAENPAKKLVSIRLEFSKTVDLPKFFRFEFAENSMPNCAPTFEQISTKSQSQRYASIIDGIFFGQHLSIKIKSHRLKKPGALTEKGKFALARLT